MNLPPCATFPRERGAALILVLAFVVLLTGLVVAYFSRTVTDRSVSQGSFNQSKGGQMAATATDLIIGELRQEIANGSTSPAPIVGSSTLYTPTNSANMVPRTSGTPRPGETPIPNLIRRSVAGDTIAPPGVPSRASSFSSAPSPAATKKGDITLARWNSHYLIPQAAAAGNAADPVDSFVAPDWVFLTGSGPTVLTSPSPSVVGRYAYAIYDEGLLDINVAGSPSNTQLAQIGRKGSLAFADLTTSPAPLIPAGAVNNLVGWRNYASISAQASPNPGNTPSGSFGSYTFSSASATDYFNFARTRTDGFLTVNSRSYPSPAPPSTQPRTDQIFFSRQELIKYAKSSAGFAVNALPYLTHFSREAEANTPQWSPAVPDPVNPPVNPNFQTLRVTGPFIRNDGVSQATVGEPLVNKRFSLQRLNWLTYKGPSALRASTDADMTILTATYGVALSFLQQGTAANILKYFGLAWDSTNERWNYVGHSGGSALVGSIATLGTFTATREPDFFELLQAGIINSSLGDSSGNPPQAPTPTPTATATPSGTATPVPTATPTPTPIVTPTPAAALPIVHQTSRLLQLMTIGANLVAQARTDSYPVRIAFNDGTIPMEAVGASRLPYVNSLAACAVGATQTAGGLHWMLIPNLWNPFRNNWDLTETTTSTPLYPRPPVRIRLDGTVSFGMATASASMKSGSTVLSNVTVFQLGSVTVANQTLLLTTGDTTHGRDGFRDANRLRTGDITTTATSYTTTNSPTTFAEWDSLTISGMSGTERFVVYRFSLAGSNIPAAAFLTSQNPVLVLNPGFRLVLEYQSANGTWYPYSFLQGNTASTTWIGNTTPTAQNLNLVTDYSTYGKVGTVPTIVNSGTSTATPWAMATLNGSPMFAKADPRSIRYNSQLGVISLPAAATAPTPSAGVIGSIWPNAYGTVPTMSPDLHPAVYSQVWGDNAAAASNPYSEVSTNGDTVRPIVMNRPFRSVGEMAYAFRDQPFKTLDFSSATSPDAGLLDLFSVNEYNDLSGSRAGVVNLNGRQGASLAAVLSRTIVAEGIAGAAAPSPSPLPSASAGVAGNSLAALAASSPVVNRAGLATLIAGETGLGFSTPKTQRDSIARALGEVVQTRTWNLMIDVIAQSGRYPPGTPDLAKFYVEGEQRYWVHVAIDRFTGKVVDRQIEVVKE